MYHCVPDFDPNAGYSPHSSSEQHRPGKPSMPEDEIIELLWQDGQLVMQSQNQRSLFRNSQPSKFNSAIVTEMRALQRQEPEEQHLFMQEDEMASWLHSPLGDEASLDHNFCSEILYPPTPPPPPKPPAILTTGETMVTGVTPRPPIPPVRSIEPGSKVHNFPIFSGHNPRANVTGPATSSAMESTMVDSNDTPVVESISPANRDIGGRMINGGGAIAVTAHEVSLTFSSGVSRTSTEPTSGTPSPEGRKRKAGETEATESPDEGVDFDFPDTKKQARKMTSTKRARASEVHNQSERRRRDKINEKMKALQELIPRCNKTDKASMLDEAIDYLKSLQLQVQMMSMGCGMMPMMYPSVQHFMPNMGMGLGMGMGMGMDMTINRPLMPYPNMFPGSALPRPSTASPLGPGYPMAPFPVHLVPNPDPYRAQQPNQLDHTLGSVRSQNVNQSGMSTFVDSHTQFRGPSEIQIQPESCSRNQCSSKGSEIPANYPSG